MANRTKLAATRTAAVIAQILINGATQVASAAAVHSITPQPRIGQTSR
jgi:hypothetical protein